VTRSEFASWRPYRLVLALCYLNFLYFYFFDFFDFAVRISKEILAWHFLPDFAVNPCGKFFIWGVGRDLGPAVGGPENGPV
jgi:hypothetical protein